MSIIDAILLPFQLVWWTVAIGIVYGLAMAVVVGLVLFFVWFFRSMWRANRGIDY